MSQGRSPRIEKHRIETASAAQAETQEKKHVWQRIADKAQYWKSLIAFYMTPSASSSKAARRRNSLSLRAERLEARAMMAGDMVPNVVIDTDFSASSVAEVGFTAQETIFANDREGICLADSQRLGRGYIAPGEKSENRKALPQRWVAYGGMRRGDQLRRQRLRKSIGQTPWRRQVAITLIRICCDSRPDSSRLPPQTLRLITPKRTPCSAR